MAVPAAGVAGVPTWLQGVIAPVEAAKGPVSMAELALEPERFCLDEVGVPMALGVA